jgi:hypothetical protein
MLYVSIQSYGTYQIPVAVCTQENKIQGGIEVEKLLNLANPLPRAVHRRTSVCPLLGRIRGPERGIFGPFVL